LLFVNFIFGDFGDFGDFNPLWHNRKGVPNPKHDPSFCRRIFLIYAVRIFDASIFISFVCNKPKTRKVCVHNHGVHHDYPKDKSRLAMPPILSLILATLFFLIFRSLMGDYVFGFLAGFLMGYTVYLAIHYSIHAFQVPGNFLKTLWHHHSIHHYREPDRAFGVSSPFWDMVFGTMLGKTDIDSNS
jgi:hypothetical protein